MHPTQVTAAWRVTRGPSTSLFAHWFCMHPDHLHYEGVGHQLVAEQVVKQGDCLLHAWLKVISACSKLFLIVCGFLQGG